MEPFTVDEEVVRAALELIDHSEQRKLSTTKRRREELQVLRKQAVELDCRLAQLAPATRSNGSQWQQLAVCQRKRRHRAEVENERLRLLLNKQNRLIERFAKELGTRNGNKLLWTQLFRENEVRVPRPLKRYLRERLIQECHQMSTEFVRVFAQPQFESVKQDVMRPWGEVTRRYADRTHIVELSESRPTPFDHVAVGDAIWHHITHHQIAEAMIKKQELSISDTQFEREYVFALQAPEPASFHARMAGMRYTLPYATVIVWVIEIETKVGTESPLLTFKTTEKVWTLVQPTMLQETTIALAQTYLVSTSYSADTCTTRTKIPALEAYLGHIPAYMETQWSHVESLVLEKIRFAGKGMNYLVATS